MKNNKPDDWKKRHFVDPRFVQMKPNGMRLETPHHMTSRGQPEHLKDKKRGAIKGWSSSSRKRMRDAILDSAAPSGYEVYAVTLTVPGTTPFTPEETKDAWVLMRKKLHRLGDCGFWRLEVQKRGAVHWHLLLCTAAGASAPAIIRRAWLEVLSRFACLTAVSQYQAGYVLEHTDSDSSEYYRREYEWAKHLDLAMSCGLSLEYKDVKKDHVQMMGVDLERNLIVGAQEHACDVQVSDNHAGWHRYMMDHCTKAKQEQVLTFTGMRHWGFINKKKLIPAECCREKLTYEESITLLRIISKWSRPRIRAACCFGSRLGFRTSRGRRGASVWFGNPDLYERIIAFARANPAQTRLTPLPAT